MPFFIPILITTLIIVSATGVALNWDKIATRWSGKKLAILGARGVGKTHLLKFLSNGSIPKSDKQTIRPEKVKGRRFKLRSLDLKIKETRDLSGGDDEYGNWKELFDEADVVFYLLRIHKLMAHDEETKDRVIRDMEQIRYWLKEQRKEFFIVGTHGDLANPDLTRLQETERGDWQDKIRRQTILQDCVLLAGGAQNAKVVLGSLKSREETEALVYGIFSQINGQQ